MIYKLECVVFIETSDDRDPEELASEFDGGFRYSVEGFNQMYREDEEVLTGRVLLIAEATETEIDEHGLRE